MVEAACCIVDKGRGYDIENDFNGWVKKWIKEKLGIE